MGNIEETIRALLLTDPMIKAAYEIGRREALRQKFTGHECISCSHSAGRHGDCDLSGVMTCADCPRGLCIEPGKRALNDGQEIIISSALTAAAEGDVPGLLVGALVEIIEALAGQARP